MKILHLHKNPIPYLNDDEGSISWSLRQLGHEVINEQEHNAVERANEDFDLLLFHHWYGGINNAHVFSCKKVAWYFDHIDFSKSGSQDTNLVQKTATRVAYLKQLEKVCDKILVTDGDWSSPKSQNLRQGADPRLVGKQSGSISRELLYVGGTFGTERLQFVQRLLSRYRGRIGWHSGRRQPVFRQALKNQVARSKIVIAPNTPITDRYWSNRVYVMLGFGAFLLHPYCAELAKEYEDEEEIVFYHSEGDMHDKIRYYLEHSAECKRIAEGGLKRTRKEHTYLHRVERLIQCIS